jgi:hypothetical protein
MHVEFWSETIFQHSQLNGGCMKAMVSFGVGCDENLPFLLSENELTYPAQKFCFPKIKT